MGDSHAAERVANERASARLTSVELLAELRAFHDAGLQGVQDTCTYVVDGDGHLRVAPRRPEHVVCSGGGQVLAAGEIRLEVSDEVRVMEVTNQSTGFTGDVTCRGAVAAVLDKLGIARPSLFTRELVFATATNSASATSSRKTSYRLGSVALDRRHRYDEIAEAFIADDRAQSVGSAGYFFQPHSRRLR